MKTARKVLIIALCAVLLVSASVMGTLAYLTAKTNAVTNTFTVGNVSFDAGAGLDETDVDVYGVKDGEDRVTENTYKLIPGKTYTKDPQVHMSDSTEDCWLFVKIDNQIADIEAEGTTTIAEQMKALKWTPVTEGSNIYAYERIVKANEDITVFNTFTVDGNADVSTYANKTIVVQALAIQAEGFTTAAAAWTANGSEWPAN